VKINLEHAPSVLGLDMRTGTIWFPKTLILQMEVDRTGSALRPCEGIDTTRVHTSWEVRAKFWVTQLVLSTSRMHLLADVSDCLHTQKCRPAQKKNGTLEHVSEEGAK